MPDYSLPVPSTVVACGRTVDLIQRAGAEECVVAVSVDGVARGDVSFVLHEAVGVAVGRCALAVWGGLRLYVGSVEGGALKLLSQEQPIRAAYPMDDLWCLVCELAVLVIDPATGATTARYDHDEVFMESRWCGDSVVVRDFQGRESRFRVRGVTGPLLPELP